MIGAGHLGQSALAWVDWIAAGLRKLATDARHDHSPRAGLWLTVKAGDRGVVVLIVHASAIWGRSAMARVSG